MDKLNNSSLFHEKCYINGAWCDAKSGEVIRVTNPATDTLLGTVPCCGEKDAALAIEAAEAARDGWRKTPPAGALPHHHALA